MKKTVRGNESEFMGTGMGMSGKDFNLNTSNGATLKGKLHNLEEAVNQLSDDITGHKKDVTNCMTENKSLRELLFHKLAEMRETLFSDLTKVEEELKSHMNFQRNENTKLYHIISDLKVEKTELQKQLNSLNQRYSDLDSTVGYDDK